MTQRNFTRPALVGAALLALALVACEQPANDTDIAIENDVNATEAAQAEIEVLPPSEGNGVAAPAPGSLPANVIPAQYRGRWGMVAADCTSTRGDAKGLINIADRTILFYEATATLKEQRPAIATSFSGLYGFTGEGQNWQKTVTLTRTGDTLERADDEGSYTYTRCT